MLQELIDAVNAYRLEHSACEASGRKSAELNDTYVRMLQACDAAQLRVQGDLGKAQEGRDTGEGWGPLGNRPSA